jgi:hypothetical protein
VHHLAYLLNIDAVACAAEDETGPHGFRESTSLDGGSVRVEHPYGLAHLSADLFLIFSWEIDKMVIFGSDQERDSRLVEASTLSIPFLDTVERGFACQVEHEKDCYGIVANERKHVDELALTSQVPY